MDINEIDAQIKDVENKHKKMKITRESFEKLNDKWLKKVSSYMNSIEINSLESIEDIIKSQENLKKEIKNLSQYYGEDEKNFKPIEFIKSINDFVKNFKKACL